MTPETLVGFRQAGVNRISFGVQNTIDDAKAVCDALDEVVPAVRQRSPLWRA